MENGIYSVSFSAAGGLFGSGVVIVQDGRIQGGDSGFIYKGRYERAENRVIANLEVIQHQSARQSVFGSLGNFRLSLSGTLNGKSVQLTGGIPDRPGMTITMNANKAAELVA